MKIPAPHNKYCTGYPCKVVEAGANKLGKCLESYGWTRTCGLKLPPPDNIRPGDVVLYGESCKHSGHATIVTERNGGNVLISCHSAQKKNVIYTYMKKYKYYAWFHYNG